MHVCCDTINGQALTVAVISHEILSKVLVEVFQALHKLWEVLGIALNLVANGVRDVGGKFIRPLSAYPQRVLGDAWVDDAVRLHHVSKPDEVRLHRHGKLGLVA